MEYCLTTDGLVRFREKIYVPDNSELKKVILREFHAKPYSSHPGYQKTLTIVKKFYFWLNLKKDVADFVARCFNCHRVKAECKHPSGLLQPNVFPKWKWEVISMEFITSFLRTVGELQYCSNNAATPGTPVFNFINPIVRNKLGSDGALCTSTSSCRSCHLISWHKFARSSSQLL